jgi:hypothetical protein
MFLCEQKNKKIKKLLRPLCLFALWHHCFLDDHKLFLKKKKKDIFNDY